MTDPIGLTARPGCPPWCIGHTDQEARRGPQHHSSRSTRVGEQDDLLFTCAAFVSLTWWTDEDAARVHVARMRTGGSGRDSAVVVSPADAAAWADILDGAGAAELAGAIRSTLALLDEGEASR